MDELDRKIASIQKKAVFDCIYNVHIICEMPGKNCKKCGWNPRVCKNRVKAIREQRKADEQAPKT